MLTVEDGMKVAYAECVLDAHRLLADDDIAFTTSRRLMKKQTADT
jgi:hypothetical protein